MTLDEAILHAEEVAEEKENEGKMLCQSEGASIGCLKCAEEHWQLAEWLTDYKRLLKQEPKTGHWTNGNPICPYCGEDKFKDLDADIWADWQPNYCPNCGAKMQEDN